MKNINWDDVTSVSNIDQKNSTVDISFPGKSVITVEIPRILMKAIINRGEQNYIDQETERYEWNANRPD